MMVFLVKMIPQVEVEVKPDYEQHAIPPREEVSITNKIPRTLSLDSHDSPSDDTRMEDASRSDYRGEYSPSRKRPYYSSIYDDEPTSVRRRIDKLEITHVHAFSVSNVSRPVSMAESTLDSTATREEPPLFVVDQVGDTKPRGPPVALTEAEQLKTMLDSYHEIVKAIFTARTKLVECITSINWDEGGAEYSQKLSVRNYVSTTFENLTLRKLTSVT